MQPKHLVNKYLKIYHLYIHINYLKPANESNKRNAKAYR